MKNEKEEVRKLQVTGGSTYIVSLPKWWVKEQGLEAGDGVSIVMQDPSSLLISSQTLKKIERSREIEVKVSSQEKCDSIVRKILSLYLVGYDVIQLTASKERIKAAHREAIKELVRKKLVGTEIISESIEEITLRVLLSYSDLSLEDALKRMFVVASSMRENAMAALEKMNRDLAKDVIELDNEVDRFQMYLVRGVKAAMQEPRLVSKLGLNTLRECLGYRLISKSVERAADHAALIAKNVLELERPLDSQAIEMLKEVSSFSDSILRKAIDSLFKEDYGMAENLLLEVGEIYELERGINRYLEEQKPSESIRTRLILESLRRIAGYGSDVAEIVLNLTIDKED